ncbi:exopolysaccharide biosynthesis protein [Hyphobacterium marinum]|uniref:Exopolysaccharide biosynthesis protein n=1 Tax=Hyphobacterium marinum TaxID=3116574 RepID=A0ABU7LXQ8_9PROT|nr:exopolysaccharide biosynthesis protein [Hyphobacterium sp. Y6023]MEE2566304.1 exopolysaccharide biosynthesis protein [Hyphobacterium sp. Y6023]
MSTTENRGLIGALQDIARDAPDDGLTLGEFTDALGERAFGVILFALALPVCIPFLYVIPQIVALPMLALAAQMAAGRGEPWLPRNFAGRRIDKPGLERMARTGKRWFGWLERLARPRLLFLSGASGERVVGFFLAAFCTSVLVPLPLTNTNPGIATAIASLGLLTRDGILILFGLLMGTAWILLLVIGGPALLYAMVDFVRGLVNGAG